jgi:hypothetical protein
VAARSVLTLAEIAGTSCPPPPGNKDENPLPNVEENITVKRGRDFALAKCPNQRMQHQIQNNGVAHQDKKELLF